MQRSHPSARVSLGCCRPGCQTLHVLEYATRPLRWYLPIVFAQRDLLSRAKAATLSWQAKSRRRWCPTWTWLPSLPRRMARWRRRRRRRVASLVPRDVGWRREGPMVYRGNACLQQVPPSRSVDSYLSLHRRCSIDEAATRLVPRATAEERTRRRRWGIGGSYCLCHRQQRPHAVEQTRCEWVLRGQIKKKKRRRRWSVCR